jgi:hypothetical protein
VMKEKPIIKRDRNQDRDERRQPGCCHPSLAITSFLRQSRGSLSIVGHSHVGELPLGNSWACRCVNNAHKPTDTGTSVIGESFNSTVIESERWVKQAL